MKHRIMRAEGIRKLLIFATTTLLSLCSVSGRAAFAAEPTANAPVTAAPSGTEAETETTTAEETSATGCICTCHCETGHVNAECPVCSVDSSKCEYQTPEVSIRITAPQEWVCEDAEITVEVKDTKDTGNFTISKVEAREGTEGAWTDITEEMKFTATQNGALYIKVTDTNSIEYEKHKNIKCFDTTPPTFNAAISAGRLTVDAEDTQSGIAAIYVNDYEYTDVPGGKLSIRLQQFDASFESFSVKVKDGAGNITDSGTLANPYYGEGDQSGAAYLPQSGEATDPESATGKVTGHVITDAAGNVIASGGTGVAGIKADALAGLINGETEGEEEEGLLGWMSRGQSGEEGFSVLDSGREFFTITADSGKVFYLIIDRNGNSETAYFLTEISENDLLNVTSNNSETLPKNSIGAKASVPSENGEDEEGETTVTVDNANATNGAVNPTKPAAPGSKSSIPPAGWAVIAVLCVGFIAVAYYFKVVKKKNEKFVEEDEEAAPVMPQMEKEEIEYDDDDDEEESSEDAFLNRTEEDE